MTFIPSPTDRRPDPATRRTITAQRITVVLAVLIGLSCLLYAWVKIKEMKSAAPAETQKPSPTVAAAAGTTTTSPGAEIELDLHNLSFPMRGDNTPAAAPVADNASQALAAAVAMVRDGEPVEPQALYVFLHEADARYPADGYFMKRAPMVTLAELKADPAKWRGRPVRVVGMTTRLERSVLGENPSGVRAMLDGDIQVDNEGTCSFLASRVLRFQPNQEVELRGLFMKLEPSGEKPGARELVPLIILSTPIYPTPPPLAESQGAPFGWLGIGLALLFLIYFALSYFIRRKTPNVSRAEAQRRARQRLGIKEDEPDFDSETFKPPFERTDNKDKREP